MRTFSGRCARRVPARSSRFPRAGAMLPSSSPPSPGGCRATGGLRLATRRASASWSGRWTPAGWCSRITRPRRWPRRCRLWRRGWPNGSRTRGSKASRQTAARNERKERIAMPAQPRKLSEIMKEMAETLLRNPGGVPSSEAAHVALFFANVAWNESVGLDHAREGYRNVWETVEAENPALWDEFKSSDVNALIDELIRYKKAHYPDDRRRTPTCAIPEGRVRVEGLTPAAPGVDSKWEMQLYGLVRTGQRDKAIRFLQDTRRMTRSEASKRVAQVAAELGMQ